MGRHPSGSLGEVVTGLEVGGGAGPGGTDSLQYLWGMTPIAPAIWTQQCGRWVGDSSLCEMVRCMQMSRVPILFACWFVL